MKKLGFILICFGIALLLFVALNIWKQKDKVYSPIPETGGVKVIPLKPNP